MDQQMQQLTMESQSQKTEDKEGGGGGSNSNNPPQKYKKALRKVTFEMGMQFAKEKRLYFIETSAKYGINVKNLFNSIANMLYTQFKTEEFNEKNSPKQSKKAQGFRIHDTVGQGYSDADSHILKESDFTKKKRKCC